MLHSSWPTSQNQDRASGSSVTPMRVARFLLLSVRACVWVVRARGRGARVRRDFIICLRRCEKRRGLFLCPSSRNPRHTRELQLAGNGWLDQQVPPAISSL